MRRCLLVAMAAAMLGWTQPAPLFATEYLHTQRFSARDGLGAGSVRTIMQDSDGHLWVGTAQGLSRYDGHHILNFVPDGPRTPGYTTAAVEGLHEDTRHHLLWVQSPTGVVACYDLRRQTFIDYLDSLPADAPLPEYHFSERNTVFLGEYFGLRQITFADGRPQAHDYTEANGKLRSNRIRLICEDANGTLWLPTQRGLATLTPEGRLRYLAREGDFRAVTSDGNRVYALDGDNHLYFYDLDGHLQRTADIPTEMGSTLKVWHHIRWRGQWVLFGLERTIVFDLKTQQFRAPQGWQVGNGKVVARTGNYTWMQAEDRDLVLFMPDGQVRRLPLLPQAVLDMGIRARYRVVQVGDGQFCISTNGNGLFRYDVGTDSLTHYTVADAHPLLHSDYLIALCADRSGSLWVGNDLVGLTRLMPQTQNTETRLPDTAARHDRSNHIAVCQALNDSTLAVSTRDGNLYTYNIRTHAFQHEANIRNSAFGLLHDSRGRIWIGTRGSGILIDGRPFNLKTQPACPSNYVYGMAEDQRGRIWMTTLTDGLLCATGQGTDLRFVAYHPASHVTARIYAVCVDEKERLWVATSGGLYTLDARRKSVAEADFRRIAWTERAVEVVTLAPDGQGRMWAGTLQGGAVRIAEKAGGGWAFEHVGRRQGLPSSNVYSVLPLPDGDVWLATDEGLALWDEGTHSIRTLLSAEDPQSDVAVMNAAVRMPGGACFFGTTYGLLCIGPQRNGAGTTARYTPKVRITDILVGDSSLVLSGHFPIGEAPLVLPHDQRSLSIHFSTLDLAREGGHPVTYWLEGYEQPGSHTTTDGTAHYDRLPTGRYRFHVAPLAADEDTVFSFRIRPPWWNTWWIWLCYAALLGSLAGVALFQWHKRSQLRSRLQMERRLTKFKIDFFTQISHELRTPLTLIRNGIERLAHPNTKQPGRPAATADAAQLKVVERGARRLSRLVDQLLLFRRINEDSVRLHVVETDIIATVRDVCNDFFHLADSRGLHMQFTPFERHHTMLADPNIVETIVYNLVSNAVKYTPEGGSVRVRIAKPEDGMLHLCFANSALPLSDEQRRQLFQPYMHGYASQGGMGIGLYVAHRLARLCHGNLTYAEADGGVLFTLSLPTTLQEEVRTASEEADTRPYSATTPYPQAHPSPGEGMGVGTVGILPLPANSQRVVVVEDDADLAEQLNQQLAPYFQVQTCNDGAAALQHILGELPDLVLSDIVLPSLDGFALTRKLKGDKKTSHIPVVLLTSLQDDAHHVRAIQSGADAFLTKPCSTEVLVNLMAQLLRRANEKHQRVESDGNAPAQRPKRKQMQQVLQQLVNEPDAPDTIVTTLADQRFRERVQQLVAQHIGSADFNVDALTEQMGIGRTIFFRRFRQIMDCSPSEYLKQERMRLAAQLIQQEHLNVSQVAQRTGFSDSSHFIRAFKAYYGVTPNQFRQV